MDRSMVDAASGGALVDKTPEEARRLIENMATNSQQFGTRSNSLVLTKGVHEIQTTQATNNRDVVNKLDELASLVRQMAISKQQSSHAPSTAKVCGICTSHDHPTDTCPTLHEDDNDATPKAYAANIFNDKPQQQSYDLSSNRYNPGWRNHPNLRWGNSGAQHNQSRQQFPFYQAAGPSKTYQPALQQHVQQPVQSSDSMAPNSKPSLEELVQQMAMHNLQFQQRTEATIQNLETQVGQIASSLNQLQSKGSDKLPAQPVVNPNVSAISLRSGKTIDMPVNVEQHTVGESSGTTSNSTPSNKDVTVPSDEQQSIPLPFPQRAVQRRKMDEDDKNKEILETFRKVEVNIPLLEAIKQIPRYAKFLKELCTNKRRLKGNERISMGRNVSAIIQPMMPQKCKDPGTFTIPCTIGNNKYENAMLDLGASINVMPMSVFNSLALGPMQNTGVVIQLANRSNAYPAGLIEDVLVRVNELIFPADFYILDMEGESNSSKAPIILGRPFLKTARTKIDVHAGTLSMEFGDSIVRFNILDAMKHPMEEHSVSYIELLADLNDDTYSKLFSKDFPSLADFDDTYICQTCTNSELCSVCAEIEAALQVDSVSFGNQNAVMSTKLMELEYTSLVTTTTSDFVEL